MFALNLSLILLFLYFACLLILDPNRFEPSVDHTKKNNFCQSLSSDAALIDTILCQSPYRKKSFLWFMIDGLANSQVHYLRKKCENRANLFSVDSRDFYRQSGALHEMYLTGKFSNNFVGDPILIDNLLLQMNQAGHKLEFFGSPYPVAYLGGGPTSSDSIYFNVSYIGIEEFPFEFICPNIKDTLYNGVHLKLPSEVLQNRSKLYSFLDEEIRDLPSNLTECFMEKGLYPSGENNFNLIYYTAMIDNHNHAFSKENPHAIKVTYGVEKFAEKLMDWVDENPEYAVFLTSDHGGQDFFGEDSFCNHGCIKPDNKGIFFAYISDFRNGVRQEKQEIDIFDVAPTVSQLIEGVNVPIFAKGDPAVLGKDAALAFASVRAKEVQLMEYIKDFENDVRSDEFGKSYSQLKEIKTLEEFEELRKNGGLSIYQQEVNNLKEFFEQVELSGSELYKFYPIMFFIVLVLIYIWKQLFLRKDLSVMENIPILVVIWLNFYFDSFLAFYRAIPFETSNKFTLYISCLLVLVITKLYNKDINYLKELKLLFNFHKRNESNELPATFQEFENLSKSVQVSKKRSENKNKALFLLSLLIFLSLIFLYSEVYVDLKKFQSFWEKSQMLDFLTYPVFVHMLFKYIEKENKNWVYQGRNKVSINIVSFLKKYYIVVIFMMVLYDIKRPRNFVNQDWSQQYLTRIVYLMLFLHLCWIFSNKERVYDKDLGKSKKNGAADEILSNIKLPILAYLFFLNDEMDRMVLCFYIFPLYKYLTKIYRKSKSPIFRLFIFSFMMKVPDILHVICKGTMTFDISLPAGNKTIGRYQDEYPIFTGVLFGTHKLQQYMLCAIFLMGILGEENIDKSEETNSIFQLSFTKYLICNLPLWYYVFSKQQSFYLIIFMFCMGKAMLVALFYLLNLSRFVSMQCRKRVKRDDQENR